jgi:LPXTG-motif cell wall-anchored protein
MQNMGSSILVRTDQGMKMFSQGDMDKRGVKIMKDGKPVDISELRANDQLTATIVTSKPPRVLTEKQVEATLAKSSGGAGAPAAAAPARSTAAAPAAAPAPTSAATSGAEPRKLPKTASPLPLLGLVGLGSLITGLGLTVRRRRATR